MTSSTKADWLIPTCLIALSLVPTVAGMVRLVELGGGAEITPANARFFAAPWPVVLHILGSVVFCLLGAFQFSAGLRHRAWMLRGYALGLGAGTQVVTHLPWFLFPGIQGELARTLCMGAGWAINLAVAESLISRERIGQAS